MTSTFKHKKSCFVEGCKNSSLETPHKLFFHLPGVHERRVQWLEAINRDSSCRSFKTKNVFVCEDHFNLEQDTTNYFQVKTAPHVYKHSDLHLKKTAVPRLIQIPFTESDPSTSEEIVCVPQEEMAVDPEKTIKHKFCQTKPKVRSVSTQCDIEQHSSPSQQCAVTEPEKFSTPKSSKVYLSTPSASTVTPSSQTSDFKSEYEGSSSDSDVEEENENKEEQLAAREMTINKIKKNTKHFVGVPQKVYTILMKSLLKNSTATELSILIVLYKIKTNLPMLSLAYEFGCSESTINRRFHKTVPILSKCFSRCIYWPSKRRQLELLPAAFTQNYSRVQAIIDCLEVEIQKPTDVMEQALTYSRYKKCNTIKYLISSTAYGFINFVSPGFGGRTSDTVIFEKSGFLDIVPEEADIMADRGFKHVINLLTTKKCQLIRPPSVSANEKMSADDVKETRRIASLRVHIERVIRRVREYAMVKPHACVPHSMIGNLDHIIVIVCGLVNMQDSLIKS